MFSKVPSEVSGPPYPWDQWLHGVTRGSKNRKFWISPNRIKTSANLPKRSKTCQNVLFEFYCGSSALQDHLPRPPGGLSAGLMGPWTSQPGRPGSPKIENLGFSENVPKRHQMAPNTVKRAKTACLRQVWFLAPFPSRQTPSQQVPAGGQDHPASPRPGG